MLLLEPDTVVDDRFRIVRALGIGGTSTVFQAEQLGFERVVALKILQPGLLTDDESRTRFQLEAQVLCQLRHRNVAQVYSFGIAPACGPYIAMEYIEGESLETYLKKNGKLKLRNMLLIAKDVCAALMHIHALGIVHRDVKPGNLIITEQDGVRVTKLTDFGLCKFAVLDQKITAEGCAPGTPSYMSPEQLRGEPATVHSDLYALGCIMYECLFGKPPYRAMSYAELALKHALEPIPLIEPKRAPKSWSGITDLLRKVLSKEPDERPKSAEEMRDVIMALLSSEDLPDETMPVRLSKSTATINKNASPIERKIPPAALLTALAAIILLLSFSLPWFARQPTQLRNTTVGTTSTVKLPPTDKIALARGLEREQKYEDAVSLYKDAMHEAEHNSQRDRQNEAALAMSRLIVQYKDSRESPNVVKYMQELVQRETEGDGYSPLAAQALNYATRAYLLFHQADEAWGTALRAVMYQEKHFKQHTRMLDEAGFLAAKAAVAQGDYRSALSTVSKLKLPETDPALDAEVKAICYAQAGKRGNQYIQVPRTEIDRIKKDARLNPDRYAEAFTEAADYHVFRKLWNDCLIDTEKAAALYPNCTEKTKMRGMNKAGLYMVQALFELNKLGRADHVLSRVREKSRYSSPAEEAYTRYWQARIDERSEKYEKAISEWLAFMDAMKKLRSPQPEHLIDVGNCYAALGNYASAETSFRNLISQAPSTKLMEKAKVNMGLLRLQENRSDEALALFRTVARDRNADTENRTAALAKLSEIFAARKQWTDARDALITLLAINKDTVEIRRHNLNLARCASAAKDPQQATDALREYLTIESLSPREILQAENLLASIYTNQSKFTLAISELRSALRIPQLPEHDAAVIEAKYRLAQCYLSIKKPSLARTFINSIRTTHVDSVHNQAAIRWKEEAARLAIDAS